MAYKPFRLQFFLLVGAIIVIIVWFIGPSGRISGIEFSPDLFSHRSFHYYEFCQIPFTPKRVTVWRSHIDDYLHQNGFITDLNIENPRWHLVKGSRPAVAGWRGEAVNKCYAVGCFDGSNEWVKWSEKYPELGQIVWPQVVTWARNEQYYEISALFRLTELEKSTSPEDVQAKIVLAEQLALE